MQIPALTVTEVPVSARPPARLRFGGLLAVSLAVHAVAGLALLIVLPRSLGGDDATQLDAISVSLVAAQEIAPASVATVAVPAAPAPQAEATVDPVTERETPLPSDTAQREDVTSPAEELPREARADVEIVLPPRRIDTASLQSPPVIQSTLPVAAQPDQSSAAAAQVSAAPAANSGAATRYARSVALAVAKHAPSGVGQKGRVDIEFLVAERTGALQSVRIARSSGNARLDGLALKAVEKAGYPPPPPELTVAERTFRMPFNFD